jgi:hypothetical protein
MPLDGEFKPVAKNVRRVGHLDLPGAGQIEVQDGFAYVGHMDRPNGTSILDVSDPKNPKVVSTIDPPDYSHTHKVRIAGDRLYTNVEQDKRHLLRLGDKLPGFRTDFEKENGRAATDQDCAAFLGRSVEDIPMFDEARERGYDGGGWRLWDVADKANPKLLSYTKTHGFGTHRFDADERYAYISTEMDGFVGNILVTYDCQDPTKPQEVSRWWMPGQNMAAGEKPWWTGYSHRLHHAMRFGDEMWAAVWQSGYRVIDIKDIRNPKTVGEIPHPPVVEPSHTIMPIGEINGRRIAVGIDEEHANHVLGQPHACMWTYDVTDLTKIQTLSSYHVQECDSPYSRMEGLKPGDRFGAHQFHEKPHGTLIFATWFSGGLRIVDIKNPKLPEEVGYFIPEPCGGFPSPQANDVFVDDRNLIYMVDRNCGLDILEYDL